MNDRAMPTASVLSAPGESQIDRLGQWLRKALETEERDGQLLAIKCRSVAVVAIAVLLGLVVPFPQVLYYFGLLAVFMALGLLDGWLTVNGRRRFWHGYVFAALDFALMTFTILYPNPFITPDHTPQLNLQSGKFVYFFIPLGILAFSYRPNMMLFGGIAGALAWTVGIIWIVMLPETKIWLEEGLSPEQIIQAVSEPTYVDMGMRLRELVIFLIVAASLAITVARSRRLVMNQVASERQRVNLSRYFPPNMVDQLAQADSPLTHVREQNVAVLFADLVGFTRWSEKRTPTEVIDFLRQVHVRLERAIFEHGGTLDKFMGDGIMATFGTPEAGKHDAANALRSLRSIVRSFEDWNAERLEQGLSPVRISIGLHYGTVVTGDIGPERRLEFAVLGDAVNLASRLERLTRRVDCLAVVSDTTLRAVRRSEKKSVANDLTSEFTKGSLEDIRGRQGSVRIWTL
jgi:adenylate cyclase